MKDLASLRAEIDLLDEQLWDVIGKRAEIVREIGEWKRQHDEKGNDGDGMPRSVKTIYCCRKVLGPAGKFPISGTHLHHSQGRQEAVDYSGEVTVISHLRQSKCSARRFPLFRRNRGASGFMPWREPGAFL